LFHRVLNHNLQISEASIVEALDKLDPVLIFLVYLSPHSGKVRLCEHG
jgi:hypothetical protein